MLSSRRRLISLVPALLGLLAACGGEEPPPVVAPAPTAAPAATEAVVAAAADTAAPAAAPPREEGHRYFVSVAACWFGGLWALTDGETAAARKEADQARCHEVVKRTYGSDDLAHYEKLRALEPNEVEKLATKLENLASSDPIDGPRKESLAKMLKVFADAQRENMFARRAADRIKKDLKGDKEPSKLSKDEADAVEPLRAHRGLEELFNFASTAGELGGEAHALAVLTAMDRMTDTRGLPRHMKIYAVGSAFSLLFGVTPPEVPADATTPLKPGTWVTYLSEVARAAGHPVPATAKTPKDRDVQAWAGVLQGFADKLEADASKVSGVTDLGKLVPAVAKRLAKEHDDDVKNAAPAPATKKK